MNTELIAILIYRKLQIWRKDKELGTSTWHEQSWPMITYIVTETGDRDW